MPENAKNRIKWLVLFCLTELAVIERCWSSAYHERWKNWTFSRSNFPYIFFVLTRMNPDNLISLMLGLSFSWKQHDYRKKGKYLLPSSFLDPSTYALDYYSRKDGKHIGTYMIFFFKNIKILPFFKNICK